MINLVRLRLSEQIPDLHSALMDTPEELLLKKIFEDESACVIFSNRSLGVQEVAQGYRVVLAEGRREGGMLYIEDGSINPSTNGPRSCEIGLLEGGGVVIAFGENFEINFVGSSATEFIDSMVSFVEGLVRLHPHLADAATRLRLNEEEQKEGAE